MTDLTKEEEITKAAYDKYATIWAKKYSDDEFYAKEYKKFHNLLPSGKIIEIGAGSGRDAEALIKLSYEYVGVDLSESLLEIARQRVPKATFLNRSIYDLGVNHKFDGFWCTATLLHIPKARINEALSSIKAVLKPEAIGFITIKNGHGSEIEDFEIEKGATLKRFYEYWNKEDFSVILSRQGFEIIEYNYRSVNSRQMWHCFFVRLK